MLIAAACLSMAILTAAAFKGLAYLRLRKAIRPASYKMKQYIGVNDYRTYSMSRLELFKCYVTANCVLVAAGWVFFRDTYICVALCSLSFIYPVLKKKDIIKKRKENMCQQFREALQSVAASLSAGRSIEIAFKMAVEDLKIIYPSGNADIIKEFELINRKVEMNESLKSALMDFAERSDIEDIRNFVDVFIVCKDAGGNLVEVIRNTCSVINQKIDIMKEIDVIVAEQKLSQRILGIMPFILLVLIIISSPDYVRPLYTPQGHIVMLVVLALLMLSYFISDRIMNIKV